MALPPLTVHRAGHALPVRSHLTPRVDVASCTPRDAQSLDQIDL